MYQSINRIVSATDERRHLAPLCPYINLEHKTQFNFSCSQTPDRSQVPVSSDVCKHNLILPKSVKSRSRINQQSQR